MNLNITVNEAGSTPTVEEPGTHNVRVHFTEADAGHVSGPFSLSVANAFAVQAIGKVGVINVEIEPVA